jgi:uroporphyrinogen-III synthase
MLVCASRSSIWWPTLLHRVSQCNQLYAGPRQYASKLNSLLTNAGARPLWVPCIEITALDDGEDIKVLDAALDGLSNFSHIAFTSKNGIRAVLNHLEAKHGELGAQFVEQSGVRVCALGADSLVLEAAGYKVHIMPEEASTQGLVRELVSRGEAKDACVLCPVPKVTGTIPLVCLCAQTT